MADHSIGHAALFGHSKHKVFRTPLSVMRIQPLMTLQRRYFSAR